MLFADKAKLTKDLLVFRLIILLSFFCVNNHDKYESLTLCFLIKLMQMIGGV